MTYHIILLLLSLLYYIFGLHATSITIGNHKHHLPKYRVEHNFSVLKKTSLLRTQNLLKNWKLIREYTLRYVNLIIDYI